MSQSGNGQRRPYNVQMSQQTRALLQQLRLKAAEVGAGPGFVSAYRQIIERLRDDPTTFGEPLYHLPALHLLVYQAAIKPLVVIYGVHDDKPLVFIRGFKTLS